MSSFDIELMTVSISSNERLFLSFQVYGKNCKLYFSETCQKKSQQKQTLKNADTNGVCRW